MVNKQFAVIGNPIAHSKSPLIHQAFAKQFDITLSYERIESPIGNFAKTVRELQKLGFYGANVTVPFKFEAYQQCQHLSIRAKNSGAVNTLSFIDHTIHGDNTDGIGLRRDIELNFKQTIAGKDILILGAGGAAHGLVHNLIEANSITIANRSSEKAVALISKLDKSTIATYAVEYQQLTTPFDIVINATSAGLSDGILPLPSVVFSKNTLAYEMMYGRETPFMSQAQSVGAQVADGLGMLIEQAAEAFFVWHQQRPNTSPVLAMLRTKS